MEADSVVIFTDLGRACHNSCFKQYFFSSD